MAAGRDSNIVKLLVIIRLLCSQVSQCSTDNVSDGSCPPWYYTNSEGKCSFVHQLPQIVRQYGNSSELEMGFCMTVTNTSIVVGQCPYIPVSGNIGHLYHNIYQVLPTDVDQVNSSLCAPYNRRGFLCSECKEGHGLAVYRYYGLMCVKCSHPTLMLIAYLTLLFIPPTIFFFSFLVLKINIHSGNFSGFIHFSHVVTNTIFFYPQMAIILQTQFGYWPVQILLSLYGIWSLNFLQFLIPPFCVSPRLTTLQLISLGYIPSVYPLLLCFIISYLINLHGRENWLIVTVWSPFQKLFKRFNIHSIQEFLLIKTFGTFILFSYGINLFVSFSLVQGSILMELNLNTNKLRGLPPRSVDLQDQFFGPTHAPYAVLGIVGGVLTVILPLVLVLIFPTRVFPKLIPCCGLRRWHAMRTFMEVFTSSYKDGTEQDNKRDYRGFIGIYLILRIFHDISWHANGAIVQPYSWPAAAMILLLLAVIVAFLKPHRKLCHNLIDVLVLLLLATMCICLHIMFGTNISQQSLHVVGLFVIISGATPHVILISFLGYKLASWIVSRKKAFSLEINGMPSFGSIMQNRKETQPLLAK